MLLSRFMARMLVVGLMVIGAGLVSGQDYPNKPVRILTSTPGGGNDFAARLVAQGIAGPLGQPVIVDNRGSGTVSIEAASKAPADGYNLLVTGSTLWILPQLRQVPYDVARDLVPISLIARDAFVLALHSSMPAKSVRELIVLAKARPGELNYGSSQPGGSSHLAAELFKSMAGVNIVWVGYKGNSQAVTGLITGETQMLIADMVLVRPHVTSGKIRALAVTSATPSALAPALPTVAASGLPGFEATGMTGIFAPAKTPEPIINRLNQEVVRALARQDLKQKVTEFGSEPMTNSPQEFATLIKSDISRWAKVIKDARIKLD